MRFAVSSSKQPERSFHMFTELAKRIRFPEEAIAELNEKHELLMKSPKLYAELYHAMDAFFMEGGRSFVATLDRIADEAKIPNYTVHMIFVLLAAKPLHYLYAQKGIPDDVYYDTLTDLTCKLWECKKVHNVWGTFVVWWYPHIYACKIVKLGRLEYEPIKFPYDDYKGILKNGDQVYSCHIPSSGPVTRESVIESFKLAYEFYEDELRNGLLPVYCSSWMLYPQHKALYGERSNLRSFYELFDIIDAVENTDNHNFWRIFNIEYSPETLDSAPEDTSLQRSFKSYIKQGNNMGTGKGILLFDGEKIVDH